MMTADFFSMYIIMFRQSSDLGVHRRKHTGAYIHYCKLCERGFRTGSDLRKHMSKVHPSDGTARDEEEVKKETVQTWDYCILHDFSPT